MGKFLCAIIQSSLFWMIMAGLFCLLINIGINISLVYLWLFLIDELSLLSESLLFLKYFIILILFFYNYFLIRKLVILWLFEWQFPFQIFSIYKERQAYLTFLKLLTLLILKIEDDLWLANRIVTIHTNTL